MSQRSFAFALCALVLSACGGGGGGDAGMNSAHTDQPAVNAGNQSNGGGNTAAAITPGPSSCSDVRYGAAPGVRGALPTGARIVVADATTKVRADANLDVAAIADIAAARNEYEMFQVIVRGDSSLRISDIHYELPTLPSAGLSDLDRVMIYRAGYMRVTQRSNSEGATGLWPDALIPKIDSYTCETRNAFPYEIAAGRNQSFYVDVYVPRGTAAGTYPGTLTVSGSSNQGEFVHQQALDLAVWNFTVPSTSSLQSSFGFISSYVGQGHRLTLSNDQNRQLGARYALSGLRHRIAVTTPMGAAPTHTYSNGVVDIDWSIYDADVTPFLNGSAHHTGATWSAIEMRPFSPRVYQTDGVVGLTAFYKNVADHFRERGWFDKLWGYTRDEPRSAQYEEVKERARAMLAADSAMRPLVTKNIDSGLVASPADSPIRIWTPLINQMTRDLRTQFDPYLRAGAQLWWYQSCESHGCLGEDVTGYPSYMIDVAGTANRAMEWLSFSYGVGGELYFNTMEAYYKVGDVWDTQFLFDGNGDGTLFYPGRPDRIGGSAHIPIESLRLKLVREGYEDYEYLQLLAQSAGDRAFLDQQVASVAREPRDFARDAQSFYRARGAIANRIAERVGSGVLIDRSDGR